MRRRNDQKTLTLTLTANVQKLVCTWQCLVKADRKGYPEIAEAYKRYAWEEAEHAAKFAELLGDMVWDTKTNLEKRMAAEAGANADKMRIAKRAKELNLDAIHDTVHEMAKDEARHGQGFEGLYNRFFKK